jgi:hypothetical protein
MLQALMTTLHRPLSIAALGVVLGGIVGLPAPAKARVWIGFGFPLVVGPPAYYPPPVYYPPPPAYYPPPPYYPPAPYYPPSAQYVPPQGGVASGQSCYASGTVCPMDHPVASGSACYCTTAQGRVWGRAT